MPPSSKRQIRESLFDVYSQNLTLVKKYSNIKIEPNIEEAFLCPLCFRIFPRGSLDIPQVLTLEHVPPEVFGGKDSDTILLCGECNHTSGSKLDRQIQIKLDTEDFIGGIPGAFVEGKYSIGTNPTFVGTIRIPAQNTIQIEGDAKRSNPKEKEKEIEYVSSLDQQGELSGKFSFRAGNRHLANIGLLRIAYLMAFRTFGYGLIFHPHMSQVRDQIRDPQATILPRNWVLTSKDVQQSPLGINIIWEPEEFRCFLIVFDLASKLRTTRQVIVLPNTGHPGINIYNWLEQRRAIEEPMTFNGSNIPANKDLLLKPEHCFISHLFWKGK